MTRKATIGYLVAAAALVLASANAILAGPPTLWSPATAAFRDQTATQPTDKIRSDGLYDGFYYRDVNCVISWWSLNGPYFLRTDNFNCIPAVPRMLTFDFSAPVSPLASTQCSVDALNGGTGTLNACGTTQIVDARMVADKLFNDNALKNGTPVTFVLSIEPDFSNSTTTSAGQFQLDFEHNVSVTGDSVTRTLTAPPDAVADLYVLTKKGNKLLVGKYYMPFSVTVTLQ